MVEEGKDWLNVSDAADYLKVSRKAIYHLMEQGLVPYTEIRGLRGKRIKKEDLDALFRHFSPEEKRSSKKK